MASRTPRSPYPTLLALTVAQLVVAGVVRWLLWPQVGPVALARTFLRADLLVIAGYGAVVLALAVAGRRSLRGGRIVAALAWTVALAHSALLAINYSAETWLRAPLTLSWMQMADFGGGETPWVMVRSVVDAGIVAGLIAALLLPFVLVLILRWPPVARQFAAPWPLAALIALCALVGATGHAGRPTQWRDGVSNPAAALWSSLWQVRLEDLVEHPGDGRSADYALRPAAPPATQAATARPDMLIVVMESVSAKAVAENIAQLPTLARLSREGTVFPNASVSVAASSRSIFALMFSRQPRLSYVFEGRAIESGYPASFLESLRRADYATNFLLGGDFDFQGVNRMLDRGQAGPRSDFSSIPCDRRTDRSSARLQHNVYLPDRCTFAEAERWFGSNKGPRAAIVWPISTHFPYDFDGLSRAPSGSRQAYIDALRVTDRLLGETLAHLAAKGIKPLVVVTGDHGEAFGEHGFVMHGQTMFQEEVGTPLILSGPGVPAGRVDQRLAQIADIAPTLLSLAGLPRPCGWQGLSLLGPEQRARAFAFALVRKPMAGFREGNVKYMLDITSDTAVRYNLATDPTEQHPVALDERNKAAVKAALSGWAAYNDGLYNHGGDACARPFAKGG